jgi:hypothetical protein
MSEPMELHKSSNGKNVMVDKAINTDLVNLTTQRVSVDVKRFSHVKVETREGMKKTQIQKLIKKNIQVYEVKINLQGCLIDILIT